MKYAQGRNPTGQIRRSSYPLRSLPSSIFNLSLLWLLLLPCLFNIQEAQAQSPPPCTFAPKTDYGIYPEPPLPQLPPAGGKFCDQTFGTQIMRVTDATDSQSNGTYYSIWPTFNSDNTRLLVRINNSAAIYSFNPTTFTLGAKQSIPGIPNFGGSLITEGAIWSNSDPNVLYGVEWNTPKLWALNVATNTYSLVRDFSNVQGVAANDHFWQMSMSESNDVFAFTRRNHSEQDMGYIVYRRSTNTIISNVSPFSINGVKINEVQIDKTGRYLSIPLECAYCTSFYVRDLQNGTQDTLNDESANPSPGHGNTGTANLVAWDRWNNRILYRSYGHLQDYLELFAENSDWTQGKHISMRAINEGWALVSNFNASTSTPRNGAFHNELFQVATDGSQRVRRLLHHRSVYRDYWESPRANISRDGRFVAFSSTWGDSGRIDLFVARIDPAPSQQTEDVVWTNLVGVTANGNDLVRNNNTAGWNAGANSVQTLSSDGFVEFSTDEISGKMCGLSNGSTNNNYTEIDYALSLGAAGNVRVYENGVLKGAFGTYLAGDKFKVSVEGSVVKYYRNAALLYTSAVAPTFPLLVDTSLYTPGATITDAIIHNGPPQDFWTNLVGVAASGNDLTKTSASVGWNAGANSVQTLSGNGYVEFSTDEISGKMCGLSNGSTNNNYTEIDYALSLGAAGNVRVYENGVLKGSFGTYSPGDTFRVAVESGAIKYYWNGAVFYTSAVVPSFPLLVDTSFYTPEATLTNVSISGAWSN
jgi:hypothetical protein